MKIGSLRNPRWQLAAILKTKFDNLFFVFYIFQTLNFCNITSEEIENIYLLAVLSSKCSTLVFALDSVNMDGFL
jgi:hypothetical protein